MSTRTGHLGLEGLTSRFIHMVVSIHMLFLAGSGLITWWPDRQTDRG
jgi:uncharacterized iron-regulated membrane protein